MVMMKTIIAIEVINDGNGDNEISNDDNDDSDSNDKDYVYTRQLFDPIRHPKRDRLHPAGPNGVYPSLPKFTLADDNRSCMQFVPREVRPLKVSSDLPQFSLGNSEVSVF